LARIIRIIKLPEIRNKVKSLFKRKAKPNLTDIQEDNDKDIQLVKKILTKARDLVLKEGGKLVFVYLPSGAVCKKLPVNEYVEKYDRNRNKLLSIVNDLDIPLIDIYNVLFSHPDPLALYPLRYTIRSHFSAKGYEQIAQKIDEKIFKIGN